MQTCVIHNKSSESMAEVPSESVHLIVTSPPYNVGKEYESDLSLNSYLDMLDRVWRECKRVLVHGGRLCVNVANTGRKPYLPLNYFIGARLIGMGFLMMGEVLWDKGASVGSSTAWGSWRSPASPSLRDVHEYIMVFGKGSFARNRRADESSKLEGEEFMELTKSIWAMRTESAKKVNHPAPFPVELPGRLIRLYSFKGDVVLDPFMGSGTTAVAAELAGRRWIGYELDSGYIDNSFNRLKEITAEI